MNDIKFKSLKISIFVVSDTRNESSDKSGKVLEEKIKECGHHLTEKFL